MHRSPPAPRCDLMARAKAFIADENGYSRLAAAGYEAALQSDPADIEARVNLAVLYWEATRFCFDARPSEFSAHARGRLHELLESAADRFGGRPEIRFWREYIAAEEAGEPLPSATCRELMNERPDYLEPAFVMFSNSEGLEAEPEAMRLLAACSEQPTARARYVTSMINTALRKQRWSWVDPTPLDVTFVGDLG